MILVDDFLARAVMLGDRRGLPSTEPVATTWGFHHRLIRALLDRRTKGSLSQGDVSEALAVITRPERHGVHVIDPRTITAAAATIAIDHRLNLLTSEVVAGALENDVGVYLTERNVGRRWPDLFDALGLTLTIV